MTNLTDEIFRILKDHDVSDDDAQEFYDTLVEAGCLYDIEIMEVLEASIDEETLMMNFELYQATKCLI